MWVLGEKPPVACSFCSHLPHPEDCRALHPSQYVTHGMLQPLGYPKGKASWILYARGEEALGRWLSRVGLALLAATPGCLATQPCRPTVRGWEGVKQQLPQQLAATLGSRVSAALAGVEKADAR